VSNLRRVGKAKRAHPTAVAITLALILAGAASAQQPSARIRSTIWDVQLGTSVSELPEEEFVDPACGTNGGPPAWSQTASSSSRAARGNLRHARDMVSIRRRAETIARAARDPDAVARNNAMVVLGQPVILSLWSTRRSVQGFRIFTRSACRARPAGDAYRVAVAFTARFGPDGWECATISRRLRARTPIMGTFVKRLFRRYRTGSRLPWRAATIQIRAGMLDPNTGRTTVNQLRARRASSWSDRGRAEVRRTSASVDRFPKRRQP